MGTKVTGVMVLEGTLGLSLLPETRLCANSLLGDCPREHRESEEAGRKMQTRGSLQTGQHGELLEPL